MARPLIRRLLARASPPPPPPPPLYSSSSFLLRRYPSVDAPASSDPRGHGLFSFLSELHPPPIHRRFFASRPEEAEGPAAVDYRTLLPESEFHRLADETIHDLQEKFEEFGDTIQIDGFDIDYGNQVLTLKLGSLGTYVINKQTPNRQIWLSSPVSGPSRFDWDKSSEAWIYRRTKANLLQLLEDEVGKLCGKPIHLS